MICECLALTSFMCAHNDVSPRELSRKNNVGINEIKDAVVQKSRGDAFARLVVDGV